MYIKHTISTLAALTVALTVAMPLLPAHAQVTAAATPAKKALVARILKVQQPGIEGLSRAMVERPAIALMDSAGAAMQERIPADKRDALGKEIQADVKKYLDDAVPLVTSRATKLAPTTLGPFLEEKFTEDELKQLIAIIESPVNRKYQQMGGEFQKVLTDKLVADTKGSIEPKIQALDQAIVGRLGLPPPPPAKAASK